MEMKGRLERDWLGPFSTGPLRPLIMLPVVLSLSLPFPLPPAPAELPLPSTPLRVDGKDGRQSSHSQYLTGKTGAVAELKQLQWRSGRRILLFEASHDLMCAPTTSVTEERWQTSNSEYGKFYPSMHRDEARSREIHRDCSNKCENLRDQLKLAKSQLEKLKITSGRSLSDALENEPGLCPPIPRSPKQGRCFCPGGPGPPSSDMYVTEAMNQFNGARRHDPQMLMDHLQSDHPHLVKFVGPKTSRKSRNIGDFGNAGCCPGKTCCGSRSRSQSPRAGRGGKRKGTMGMMRPASAPIKKPKGPIYDAVSDLKRTAAGGTRLPPTQRYDFYRQYGYAGQGAKSSKGWQTGKRPWFRPPRE